MFSRFSAYFSFLYLYLNWEWLFCYLSLKPKNFLSYLKYLTCLEAIVCCKLSIIISEMADFVEWQQNYLWLLTLLHFPYVSDLQLEAILSVSWIMELLDSLSSFATMFYCLHSTYFGIPKQVYLTWDSNHYHSSILNYKHSLPTGYPAKI